MKRYVSYIALIYCAIIVSCDDIIEEDISDGLITVVAPLGMENIQGNSVQFRWNGVDGADEYRLQINNQTTNSVILDSLVTTTLFDYTIDAGSYAWRVRGENFAYVSPFSFDTEFTVSASEDLSNQVVTLSSPSSEEYFGATLPTVFSWEAITAASGYNFQISKIENSIPTIIFDNNDTSITTNSITIGSSVIPGDGEYTWEVQAINDTNSTNTSFFSHTFFVDTENPPIPVLGTPITGATVGVDEEISFTWTYTDTGIVQSGIASDIQIATNLDFSDVITTSSVNTEEFDFTFTTAGTFFWRVRGTDDAGNTGEYSVGNQIIVN